MKKLVISNLKKHPNHSNLKILNAIWVSFHKESKYEYDGMRKPLNIDDGSDEVFKTIVLSPITVVLGCCALTVLH